MTNNDPSPAAVLALAMRENDAKAATIRDYLIRLLAGVWDWRDDFDLKRPFGNSAWEHELYEALEAGGLIQIGRDSTGHFSEILDEQRQHADWLIANAIQSLGGAHV